MIALIKISDDVVLSSRLAGFFDILIYFPSAAPRADCSASSLPRFRREFAFEIDGSQEDDGDHEGGEDEEEEEEDDDDDPLSLPPSLPPSSKTRLT